ncbi:ABC transporter substrate-binding protein [Micromonospora sp. NBC_01412]|uniref:ABC transporter substrate-binding protein n=1 Tax=Micromonospora sp. NBC_01412 TaxID=2903590 RepID=UPI003246E654
MSPTLAYGATLAFDSLDPMRAAWNEASSLVFSRLFAADPRGELRPDLVEAYHSAPDASRFTFRPRRDVYWHDGQQLRAEDIAFTLRVASDPAYEGQVRARLRDVRSVEIDSEGVVELVLSAPAPSTLHALSRLCVLPSHRFPDGRYEPGVLDREPVGTGPYRVNERTVGGCSFVRHDAFHLGVAEFERLELVHVADDAERADGVATGRLDLAQVKAQHIARLTAANGVRVHRLRTRVWRSLLFNLDRPVLADSRVRRALSAMIDRDEIVREALGGFGHAQFTPVPPTSWAAPAPPAESGPGMAFALLESAGWRRDDAGKWRRGKVPLALRMAYLEVESFRIRASELIRDQLLAAGVDATLVPITWSQYLALDQHGLSGTDFDAIVVGWSGGTDPFENLASRYMSGGEYNRQGYSDLEFDRLLAAAAAEPSRTVAKTLYRRAVDIAERDSIMAPLVSPDYLFAARADLRGFTDVELDSFYEFTQFAYLFRSG